MMPSSPSLVRTLGAGLALALATALPATAQSTGRPDQIFVADRGGEVKNQAGVVTSDTISEVTYQQRGRDRDVEAGRVDRVVFGDVPPAYRDAQGYANRGDLENAVRKYRMVADDDGAREPVRAKARFRAAQGLMQAAAADPASTPFTEVVEEFDRFLSEHPTSRLVPQARRMQARARWISGDAASAGELARGVFEALDPTGDSAYRPALCYRAGLESARAYLAAGDTATATAVYAAIQDSLTSLMAEAEDADRTAYDLLKEHAVLGQGWTLLAEGKHGQAATFFRGRISDGQPAPLRFASRLGLAEGLLGQGKHREAQLEFAAVAGLDHTDRDNVAQALVGLVRCAQALGDEDGGERIQDWLADVASQYGDTPAAAAARELAAAL